MSRDDDERSGIEKMREMMTLKLDGFADQIRKLGELRDEGLITEEEFAAKRKELLDRI